MQPPGSGYNDITETKQYIFVRRSTKHLISEITHNWFMHQGLTTRFNIPVVVQIGQRGVSTTFATNPVKYHPNVSKFGLLIRLSPPKLSS